MQKILKFFKQNSMMTVAMFAALVTVFFVPIDRRYLDYIDFKTLSCLFCVLAVVCALKDIDFFYMLARKIVEYFHTARLCVLALVYITFIGSMLIANDMALLTFLPLGFYVLHSTHKEKYMAYVFILQNIAANPGGMLTPFGNPQNLYLYTRFQISNGEFIRIMFPPFLLAVIMLTACCLFVKGEPMILSSAKNTGEHHRRKTVLYMALFALSIAIVFRSVPYWIGLVVIPVVLFFADKRALRMVDYPLLLTFVFFFIFAGNMARISAVREFFGLLLSKNTLLFSVLSCQFISNVPSAILLSGFTSNYADLLVGVNIGGVGTLIASLASLITFREYNRHNPGKMAYYIGLFSLLNFGFLFIMIGFEFLLRYVL
ncbi:MAG: citrate transporter [Clostridia bacterium]|nr:citrate transporter [Clostridia bacterium]